MIAITGEVRKLIDADYKTKNDRNVRQCVLILEPENGRQNYEVYLNANQLKNGAEAAWPTLRGSVQTIEVSLFVSHEHKFYKFNATGTGMPLKGATHGTANG